MILLTTVPSNSDANTFTVSGSWINNATSSTNVSTVNMTASTTAEIISSTENPLTFNNLSFGSGGRNQYFYGECATGFVW